KPGEPPAASKLSGIIRAADGNRASVRALAPLSDERLLAVFDEGSIGIYHHGATVQLLPPANQISINQTQHAVAISVTGNLIAAASVDGAVVLYRCNWNAPAQSQPACASDFLGQARGRVVAISANEKRIAVGDQAGKVTIYDLDGNAHGSPVDLNASI